MTEDDEVDMDRIETFLRGSITSLPELEVLLALRSSPGEPSDADTLAGALELTAESVEEALANLRGRGLAARTGRGRWRYAAAPVADAAVARVERAFAVARPAVLRMISAHALERIRLAAARLVGREPG